MAKKGRTRNRPACASSKHGQSLIRHAMAGKRVRPPIERVAPSIEETACKIEAVYMCCLALLAGNEHNPDSAYLGMARILDEVIDELTDAAAVLDDELAATAESRSEGMR